MSAFTPPQEQEIANLIRRHLEPYGVLIRQIQNGAATYWVLTDPETIEAEYTAVITKGAAKFDTAFVIEDDDGDVMLEFFKGAAEPSAASGDTPGTIRLPAGDIINIRNVQGGVYVPGSPALLNLDLGAGAGDDAPGSGSGDGKRGNVGVNYDVGCGFIVYDGRAPEGGSTIHQVFACNMTTDNTTGNDLVQAWRPVVLRSKNGTSTDVAINTGIQADTNPRWQILQNGFMGWGPGGGTAGDTNLYRFAAARLKTDTAFDVGTNLTVGGDAQINGNLVVGGSTSSGSYITTSDERLKEDVQPLAGSLDKVNELRPVSFEWREDSGVNVDGTTIGLLAQEVQQVVPDVVKPTPVDDMPDRLGIDYTALVPVLIGAVQELSGRVADLEALLEVA